MEKLASRSGEVYGNAIQKSEQTYKTCPSFATCGPTLLLSVHIIEGRGGYVLFLLRQRVKQSISIKQVTPILCVSPAWPTLHSSEAVTANDAASAASLPLQNDITQALVTPLTDAHCLTLARSDLRQGVGRSLFAVATLESPLLSRVTMRHGASLDR